MRSTSGILSKGMPSSARIAVVEKRAAGSVWRIGKSNARRARVEEYEDSILWFEEINASPCVIYLFCKVLALDVWLHPPHGKKKKTVR